MTKETETEYLDPNERVCGNCIHAEPKKKKWFFCYRYPPVQTKHDRDPVSPDVHGSRRACGEFKSKNILKQREPNVR